MLEKKVIEEIKKYKKFKFVTYKDLSKRYNLSIGVLCSYFTGRVKFPKKHLTMLGEIFPLNKKELKKGNVVFKKWK